MKLWTVLAASLLLAPAAKAQTQFRNYTMPGNLESTVKLGCIPVDEVKTSYNPVDLYLAARVCIKGEEYQRAAELYLYANVFGRFDMKRVADRSAHQAILAARFQIFGELPKESIGKFETTLKAMVADTVQTAQNCKNLRAKGPPSYYPRYMIQHGLSAFEQTLGGGLVDGLVKDFVPATAWAQVLTDYVSCPATKP